MRRKLGQGDPFMSPGRSVLNHNQLCSILLFSIILNCSESFGPEENASPSQTVIRVCRGLVWWRWVRHKLGCKQADSRCRPSIHVVRHSHSTVQHSALTPRPLFPVWGINWDMSGSECDIREHFDTNDISEYIGIRKFDTKEYLNIFV